GVLAIGLVAPACSDDAVTASAGAGASGGGGLGAGGSGAGAGGVGGAGGQTTAPPLDWFSDWRTALGSEDQSLKDGGKWNGQLCSSSELVDVVTADGLDFPVPMTHVYRVEYVPAFPC